MSEATKDSTNIMPMVEVEGVSFPKLFDLGKNRSMKEHVESIRAMEMRDDDVILCAYPKSGTHWLWEVGSMLLAGKAEYHKRVKEHVMMEVTDVDVMQQMPSPRILNTHIYPRMLPNQVKDTKKVKVILVYRNPKDVLVSIYHHYKAMAKPDQPFTMDVMERIFLSENCPSGNYFTYLKEMDSFIKNNPHIPVFKMSFEEMKEDPAGTVGRLAKFLQVKASDALCDDIAQACSFNNLKKADGNKERPAEMAKVVAKMGKKLEMYRKGEVGDWKNHLTVAQSERMDAALEQLKDCDFRFRFTL